MKSLRVLAIDPGTDESAFVVWDGAVILDHALLPNQELLDLMRGDDLGYYGADACVIEMIASYGMPVGREVFETCVLIGRLAEIWDTWTGQHETEANAPLPLAQLVYRRDVKLHCCGDSRAKDANIRQYLIDRLGHPGVKKSPGVTYGIKGDEWQALALAVTWWDKQHRKIQTEAAREREPIAARPF
jgi:hypothetical protein